MAKSKTPIRFMNQSQHQKQHSNENSEIQTETDDDLSTYRSSRDIIKIQKPKGKTVNDEKYILKKVVKKN